MKCPDTNLDDLFCFPYRPNITGMEWWYKFPHLQMYTIVTREPDSSLNFTKITKMPFLYKQFIPVNFTTQSIVHITLMENVFCQRNMLIKNDTVIRLHSYKSTNHIFPIRETSKVVDELVYCVHFWDNYGHNIHDFLCAMMFVPQEIKDKGIRVLNPKHFSEITLDIARYLGLKINYVYTKPSDQVFAKKIWIINTLEQSHGLTSGGIERIRAIVFEKEEYKKIKPERYVVANRIVGSNRFIDNADELVRVLNIKTNLERGARWIRDDKFYDVPIMEIIKYWMSLKVIVTVQGSNIYNGIFMHEKTGMVLLFSNRIDLPNMQFCTHLHVFMIGVIHPGRHFNCGSPQPTNYTDMVNYTQRVVDAVCNGAWTSLEGLTDFLQPSYPVTNITYFILNYTRVWY